MNPSALLWIFILLRGGQFTAERLLSRLNRAYYLAHPHQAEAQRVLTIGDDAFKKTLAYTEDKYRFGLIATTLQTAAALIFLAAGGLGAVEHASQTAGLGPIPTGLIFFAILSFLSGLLSLPIDWYRTFVVEQRHGFNRQTPQGFLSDRLKGVALAIMLGVPLLSAVLWIMRTTGAAWWIWAWLTMSAFSLVTAWLYPTFLAPLFNKFSPLEPGELKERIVALAKAVGFRAGEIFVMDASKRSSHGNAYFTGIFGKKRIVLFDTLVKSLSADETTAVLAHELGHFKLHHVRWHLIRSFFMSGLTFYALSLALPLADFYRAFGLSGVSDYGALIVFGMWFGLVDFALQPIENGLSRRNEFAADRFARKHLGGSGTNLRTALLRMREESHAMPLSHPVFSAMYHSHPPLLERLRALGS